MPPTVAALAATELGTPYVYGGDTPAGFDCSGLVQYIAGLVKFAERTGITLPRTSQQQFAALPATDSPVAGDLVFFDNGSGNQQPDHVGIVASAGGATMIDAPHPGATVRVESVDGFGTIMGYRQFQSLLDGGGGSTDAQLTSFDPTDPTTWGLSIPGLDDVSSAVGGMVAQLPAAFLRVLIGDHTLGEIVLRALEVLGGAILLAISGVMLLKVIASGGESGRVVRAGRSVGKSGARQVSRARSASSSGRNGPAQGPPATQPARAPRGDSGGLALERSRAANVREIATARRAGRTTFG